VVEIIPEPTRTAHVALVGSGNKLRYVVATENMKPGDLIVTSSELTRIAGKEVFQICKVLREITYSLSINFNALLIT